jgi:hypothetical protein
MEGNRRSPLSQLGQAAMKSILSSAAKWLKAMAGHNYRSKKLMLFVMTLLLVKK